MAIWYVYQLCSETELLYVGYTRYLKMRLRTHKREKPWWSEVTEVKSEEFNSEDKARQREKDLWANERPKYNKHNPFATTEERRKYKAKYRYSDSERERLQRREQMPERLEYDRARNRSPERREYNARLKRKARAARRVGPGQAGLF